MAEEIIDEFGDDLEVITLVRGKDGQFVVTADGKQVFSKKAAGRHANPGEILDNIRQVQAVR